MKICQKPYLSDEDKISVEHYMLFLFWLFSYTCLLTN